MRTGSSGSATRRSLHPTRAHAPPLASLRGGPWCLLPCHVCQVFFPAVCSHQRRHWVPHWTTGRRRALITCVLSHAERERRHVRQRLDATLIKINPAVRSNHRRACSYKTRGSREGYVGRFAAVRCGDWPSPFFPCRTLQAEMDRGGCEGAPCCQGHQRRPAGVQGGPWA